MSDRDKELIYKARRTSWEDCDELEDQAESDEAKRTIHRIMMKKFHRAEYRCGIL